MAFSAPLRKLMLFLHVVSSVGLIGAVAAFSALAIGGATTADPMTMRSAYIAMAALTWGVIVPLAGAALLIGVIQSLGTPWGLLKYYWVVVKLALTIIVCVVLALQIDTIEALAAAALRDIPLDTTGARTSMVVHSAGGLLVLIVATVLSIYKPRGLTSYGARMLEARQVP